VYGAGNEPQLIELDHNALFHALKKETFHASILDLEIAGKSEQVLLRDVQYHPFKQLVLHVDFQRVDASQKLHTKVPLHFLNPEISPAVKLSAAIVSHIFTEIEITCLPANLPEFIAIDLSKLVVGHSIHVKDIALPVGVALVQHLEQENPVIVTATVPAGAVADEAASKDAPAAA